MFIYLREHVLLFHLVEAIRLKEGRYLPCLQEPEEGLLLTEGAGPLGSDEQRLFGVSLGILQDRRFWSRVLSRGRWGHLKHCQRGNLSRGVLGRVRDVTRQEGRGGF